MALVGQLGMLIVLNLAFGFVVPGIDDAAHLGGLVAGLWLGALIPPTRVPTMASLWQRAGEARAAGIAKVPVVPVIAVGVVGMVVLVGLMISAALRTA